MSSTGVPPVSAPATPAVLCERTLPSDWSAALAHHTIDQRGGVRKPIALRPDRIAYQQVDAMGKVTVVEVRDARERLVLDLSGTTQEVHAATYVGDDLAISVVSDAQMTATSALVLWSESTGRVSTLASPVKNARGQVIPSPWLVPRSSGSDLYWAQVTTAEPTRPTLFHRSPNGSVTTGATDLGAEPVVWHDLLLRPVLDRPGGLASWKAYGPDLREVAVPAPLRSASGITFVATDGVTLLWADTDSTVLNVWREGWKAPRRHGASVGQAWDLSVSGDLATYATTERTVVFDVMTGVWVPVTQEYGWSWVESGWLFVGRPGAVKGGSGTAHLVEIKDLSRLAGC